LKLGEQAARHIMAVALSMTPIRTTSIQHTKLETHDRQHGEAQVDLSLMQEMFL